MKTHLYVLVSLLFIFSYPKFSHGQDFSIDQIKVKNYLGISSLPGHGYAFIITKGSVVDVLVKDLQGNDLVRMTIPQKMLRSGMKRIVKPKVYFNGTSYCVVPPKKGGEQAIYTYDLAGKKLGKKAFKGIVYEVNPIQDGYIIGHGPKSGKGDKGVFSDKMTQSWSLKPSDSTVSKFKMDFALAAGEGVTSKMVTFSKPKGALINEEYRYSNSMKTSGKEDRYLFSQTNMQGGDKDKKYGVVCFDGKGNELFSEFYGKKEKSFLQAVSDNNEIYILFRKGSGKSASAEVVKYGSNGKAVKRVDIPTDDFPVVSDYMYFFMEKTPEGIALLSDARGHFYSLFLDDDLNEVSHRDFEGPAYKASKSKPKMGAIGGFPTRSLFSGVTAGGTPYIVYLDVHKKNETVRCASFSGRNLLSSSSAKNIESQITTYYKKLNPLMRSMAAEYGESYSFHKIYTNLVHPKNNDSFAICTFVELSKKVLVAEYRFKEENQ